jgi:hypothetical protein
VFISVLSVFISVLISVLCVFLVFSLVCSLVLISLLVGVSCVDVTGPLTCWCEVPEKQPHQINQSSQPQRPEHTTDTTPGQPTPVKSRADQAVSDRLHYNRSKQTTRGLARVEQVCPDHQHSSLTTPGNPESPGNQRDQQRLENPETPDNSSSQTPTIRSVC